MNCEKCGDELKISKDTVYYCPKCYKGGSEMTSHVDLAKGIESLSLHYTTRTAT